MKTVQKRMFFVLVGFKELEIPDHIRKSYDGQLEFAEVKTFCPENVISDAVILNGNITPFNRKTFSERLFKMGVHVGIAYDGNEHLAGLLDQWTKKITASDPALTNEEFWDFVVEREDENKKLPQGKRLRDFELYAKILDDSIQKFGAKTLRRRDIERIMVAYRKKKKNGDTD